MSEAGILGSRRWDPGDGTCHMCGSVCPPCAISSQTNDGAVHWCPQSSLRSWRLPTISWLSPVQPHADPMLVVGTWRRAHSSCVTLLTRGPSDWSSTRASREARPWPHPPSAPVMGTRWKPNLPDRSRLSPGGPPAVPLLPNLGTSS